MATWTNDELTKIENAEELEIASLRQDGTLRKSRTIWVVRQGSHLYVRSVRGRNSDWFRGVAERHEGHIEAGGVHKDVTFEEIDASQDIQNQLDAVYRSKYRRYAKNIVDSIVSSTARSATIKLVPR